MEIYRSAGAATLAALMAPEQGAPAVARFAAPELAPLLPADFSHIGARCERAVVTAYRDLRVQGTSRATAFEACTHLYRIHHPDAAPGEARRLVVGWIDHHLVRGEAGEAPGCGC